MKVIILGASGFIGRGMHNFLKENHDVVAMSRSQLDVLNTDQVRLFLNNHKDFDALIVASGFNKTNLFEPHNEENNPWKRMFHNIVFDNEFKGKVIFYGSGAEFSNSATLDPIIEEREIDIEHSHPKTMYGVGKNYISNFLQKNYKDSDPDSRFYVLRVFHCFDRSEDNNRLFRSYQNSIDKLQEFDYNERIISTISLRDLAMVTEKCILGELKYHDVNVCYRGKYKVSELLQRYSYIIGQPCTINKIGDLPEYTGNGMRLLRHSFKFKGIDETLSRYCE